MSGSSDPGPAPLPWLFIVLAIVVAIAVSAVVAYLGITGHLGGGIPGSNSPGNGLRSLPAALLISDRVWRFFRQGRR
jgi:hypothetical protein